MRALPLGPWLVTGLGLALLTLTLNGCTTSVSTAPQSRQGATGAPGPAGPAGEPGKPGAPGEKETIVIKKQAPAPVEINIRESR